MAGFTQFEAKEEIVIPSAAYDKFWLRSLTVMSREYGKARLMAEFIPCKDVVLGNGEIIKELQPNPSKEIKRVTIENVFEEMAKNQAMAVAMEAVFAALKSIGVSKGVFKAEEQEVTTTTTTPLA